MSDLIQHADVNIGPASYSDLASDELLVMNIWYTLQGEGPYAGFPAIFLRLAGCNRGRKEDMGCRFCDTQFHFAKGTRISFSRLTEMLFDTWHNGTLSYAEPPLLVITGGEPMMQDNLVGFLEYLARNSWNSVQIESNGDRLAEGFLTNRYCETVDLVVSPKIVTYRYLPIKEAILDRCSALKFVIDGRAESPYYSLPPYATAKDPDQIFLSPLTVYRREVKAGEIVNAWDPFLINHERTQANYQRATALALKHGYRVSMQQHLWFGVE